MEFSTRTITTNPLETQSVPTLSFDLAAPTDSSAGWTVKNVWGEDGSNDFAGAQIAEYPEPHGDLLDCLTSFFYQRVVGVLVVIWSVVLWWKVQSSATGFRRRDERQQNSSQPSSHVSIFTTKEIYLLCL